MSERFHYEPVMEPSVPPPVLEPSIIPVESATFGFTREAAKEILVRDDYTCQADICIFEDSLGRPANREDGFYVTAAHYPEKHELTGTGYHDKNPNNGRCLCSTCHAMEEVRRGNSRGAELMLRSGIYNTSYARDMGVKQVYFNLEQIKALVFENSKPI